MCPSPDQTSQTNLTPTASIGSSCSGSGPQTKHGTPRVPTRVTHNSRKACSGWSTQQRKHAAALAAATAAGCTATCKKEIKRPQRWLYGGPTTHHHNQSLKPPQQNMLWNDASCHSSSCLRYESATQQHTPATAAAAPDRLVLHADSRTPAALLLVLLPAIPAAPPVCRWG